MTQAPYEKKKKKSDKEMDSNPMEKEDNNAAGEKSSSNKEAHKMTGDDASGDENLTCFSKYFLHVSRHPCKHLLVGLVLSIGLSVIGLIAGNFSVAADNAGWQSRGTMIANRHSQVYLALQSRRDIRDRGEPVWVDLITNVQPGWEDGDGEDEPDDARRQMRVVEEEMEEEDNESWIYGGLDLGFSSTSSSFSNGAPKRNPFPMNTAMRRQLQDVTSGSALEGCDTTFYSRILSDTRLYPIWKINDESAGSLLAGSSIRELCQAELNTNAILERDGLCQGCDSSNKCLPPFSLVFFARFTVGDSSASLTCEELAETWETNYLAGITPSIEACVEQIQQPDFNIESDPLPDVCPPAFYPSMVDENMLQNNGRVLYTSSIFTTNPSQTLVEGLLYDNLGEYDRAGDAIRGAYDTQYEDFVELQVDVSVGQDMILAMGSAAITALAILVHTKSPWLTFIGLIQIILSFPLAFFVYTFVARLEFFPFLNFIGVFVVFALGADDVFVAVDKWKNARLEHPNAPIGKIATHALPDAASAMFLTTLTTAVAFFATAICPVAPLRCFAVFCGLLITFDYLMCVFLVFPALCIYDNFNRSNSGNCCCKCCCGMACCGKSRDVEDVADEEEEKESLIRRILGKYYQALHLIRWPLLVACLAALVITAIFAIRLELPKNSDVRLLNPNDFQQEQNYEWRRKILFDALQATSGNPGYLAWGVIPADTGNHNDPSTFTQLVLDEDLDASSQEAQIYLRDFCDRFFAQEFASKTESDYICPINEFEAWLVEQSTTPYQPDLGYTQSCNGASSLPMDTEYFNQCVTAWTEARSALNLLTRNDAMQFMYVRFQQRIRYDSAYNELDDEWNLIEDWMENERTNVAPAGVNKMYHSSFDFWWYDTNGNMLSSAYSAAAIALGAASAVVLFSSQSVILTIFSLVTIGYVLTSTTAMLVASGWTLGFLESVCFSILIGISCDFVIHFGHAYANMPGGDQVTRHDRTKHALIYMGPSILAAGITTICGAMVMIFTIISFFQRFATILFYTIIQATAASFIVFLTLTDTVGPARPTSWVDAMMEKCSGKKNDGEDEKEESYVKGTAVSD